MTGGRFQQRTATALWGMLPTSMHYSSLKHLEECCLHQCTTTRWLLVQSLPTVKHFEKCCQHQCTCYLLVHSLSWRQGLAALQLLLSNLQSMPLTLPISRILWWRTMKGYAAWRACPVNRLQHGVNKIWQLWMVNLCIIFMLSCSLPWIPFHIYVLIINM